MRSPHAAIVLAGGRGSRLGGVDKASLRRDGASLLDRVIAATNASQVIVVGAAPAHEYPGEARSPSSALATPSASNPVEHSRVRGIADDHPLGGPAAAVAAGLAALRGDPPSVELLSCDLAEPDQVVRALEQAWLEIGDAAGVVLTSSHGRDNWLTSRLRLDAARAELAQARPGDSLHQHLSRLRLNRVAHPDSLLRDVNTMDDVRELGITRPDHGSWDQPRSRRSP